MTKIPSLKQETMWSKHEGEFLSGTRSWIVWSKSS